MNEKIKIKKTTHRLEHLQARNGQTLGPPIDPAVFGALVTPVRAGTSVNENAHEEKINHALAFLGVVDILGKGREKVSDAVSAADSKMLVATMWGDTGKRRIVVPL